MIFTEIENGFLIQKLSSYLIADETDEPFENPYLMKRSVDLKFEFDLLPEIVNTDKPGLKILQSNLQESFVTIYEKRRTYWKRLVVNHVIYWKRDVVSEGTRYVVLGDVVINVIQAETICKQVSSFIKKHYGTF